MTPRRLSHFELLDELGAGGMGVVYRARDLELDRPVAVKVLPAAAQGDAERRRFRAEAQAASRISHPAVVTIHEVGSEGGVDFIAMELVDGRSLADELAAGALAVERAIRLAVAIADGLAAAHRIGLVHRDLKPGNLMIGAGDRVKILDFGLVKRLIAEGVSGEAPTVAGASPTLTAPGLLVGTPAYMSPEQARGETVDARSDLFSFGCVLYEMVTGRRAFAGVNPIQVLSGVLTEEPAPPSGLPEGLANLLRRLLAKDRGARPPSADAVRLELEALSPASASGSPTTASSTPAPTLLSTPAATAPQRSGRRRWLAIGGAVAAALASVALWALRSALPPAETRMDFRLLSDGGHPERDATFSPDGSAIAFVREDDAGRGQLFIRNLAGGDPLRLTAGEASIVGPDWSPLGERIVYAVEGGGLWEIPPLGGTPRRLVEHGGAPRLSPDGRRLYFVSGRRLWSAAGDGGDPQPLPGVERVHFGFRAQLAPSPDGASLAFFWPHPDRPLGDLWRLPSAGGTPERLTDLELDGAGLDWSADGRGIVFSSVHGGSRTLWRLPLGGGELAAVTRGAGEDSAPRLSRDGRRLVYTNQRNLWSVERLDPRTGRRVRAYERRDAIILPRLSHGGDRVAFFARAEGGHHLFVLDLESGRAEQLTRGERELNVHPRWSRDDRALYYYTERPAYALRRLELETGRDEVAVPGWKWATHQWSSVSPDEREIAYLVTEAGRFVETRIRSLADGAERVLPEAMWALGWLPDGAHLVGATGDDRILLCDTLALTCEALATGEFPLLSPDGRSLYLLRAPGPVAWRRELASGREERLVEIEGHASLAFGWGLRPNGELVWGRFEPGRQELWLGERR